MWQSHSSNLTFLTAALNKLMVIIADHQSNSRLFSLEMSPLTSTFLPYRISWIRQYFYYTTNAQGIQSYYQLCTIFRVVESWCCLWHDVSMIFWALNSSTAFQRFNQSAYRFGAVKERRKQHFKTHTFISIFRLILLRTTILKWLKNSFNHFDVSSNFLRVIIMNLSCQYQDFIVYSK